MEIYQKVILLILAILLGLLLIFIIPKYFKLFNASNNASNKPKNIMKSSISILQQSDEQCKIEEPYDSPKAAGYVEIVLQNKEYQILKISTKQTIYEEKQIMPKKRVIKTLEYQFELDNHFNQSYRCIENKKNQIIMYDQKTKIIYYQGNIEDAPQDKYFGSENITDISQYYFNQLITKDALIQGSSNIIDAFVQYLNLESQKQYISENINHIQTNKSIFFFPSSILNIEFNQETFIQNYQNYVFQYEPIQYELELIYQKLFFITSYQEKQDYFFIEINFTNQVTIHDLKDNKNNNNYQPYIKLLQGINPNLTSNVIICAQCKLKQRSKQSYFDVCFNMLRESQNKKLQQQIQYMEKLPQHLQSLIKL